MQRKTFRLGVWVVSIVVLAALAWHYKLPQFGYYWASMQLRPGNWKVDGVWLPYYRATIDARVIEGVENNASGLTFNLHTGTLFGVINAPAAIIELDTEGRLLRKLKLHGVEDAEGITHVQDNIFVVSDERSHMLYRVEIDPDAESVDVRHASRMRIALDQVKNRGFEGVSWDEDKQRLFVVKEKAPLRVLEISGLPGLAAGAEIDLQISEWKSSTASTLVMTDLSSLTLHSATGHLLLLSDESALIVEYASDGKPVSVLPMWRGWHGLSRRVPQAEGLAMGPDGAVYVLSEPNLFYRFEREPKAGWAR